MAAAFVANAKGAFDGATSGAPSSTSITIPAGAAIGDVALAVVQVTNTVTVSAAPSGWTLQSGPITDGTDNTWLYSKTLVSGDPGTSVTWTFSSTTRPIIEMTVFTGVIDTGIQVATPNTDSSATSTLTVPTLASVPAGAAVVALFGRARSGTSGTPADVTVTSPYSQGANERASTAFSAGRNSCAEVAYQIAASAGSYGGESLSITGGTSIGTTFLVALPLASTTAFSETFEGSTNGTTMSTANSAFNNLVQAGWTFSNAQLLASGGGSLAGRVVTSAAAAQANGNMTAGSVFYCQFYMYVTALPSVNSSIFQLTAAGTLRGEIRLNTDGTVVARNSASAAVATSSSGLVSAGAWFRCRYFWSNTAGQAQLQVFTGAALHGATATYDSGLVTSTTGGTADRLHVGVLNSQTATWYYDNVNADTAVFAAPTGTVSTLDKLKLGTNLVGLKIGATAVDKVYLGTTQVWP